MLYPQLVTLWIIALALFGKPSTPTYKYCPALGGKFIDVNTGTITQIPHPTTANYMKDDFPNLAVANGAISPDGRSVVIVPLRDVKVQGTVYYKPVLPIALTIKQLDKRYREYGGFTGIVLDIKWSPDGKYVAYSYSTDNGQFLGLADSKGHILKEVSISPQDHPELATFDSWSPDSKYIAMTEAFKPSKMTWERQPAGLSIWSVPNLTNVAPKDATELNDFSCDDNEMYDSRLKCIHWSPSGHRAAVVVQHERRMTLRLFEPEGNRGQEFQLPSIKYPENIATFVLWSPDAEKVALADYFDPTNGFAQITVYGWNGTISNAVDIMALGKQHSAERHIVLQWEWADDSQNLFYVRDKADASGIFEIIRYNLSKRSYTTIATISSVYTDVTLTSSSAKQFVLIHTDKNPREEEKYPVDYFARFDGQGIYATIPQNHYELESLSPDNEFFVLFAPFVPYTLTKDSMIRVYRTNGMLLTQIKLDENNSHEGIEDIDWWECDSVF